MKTVHMLTVAAALAGSALFALPAGAAEVCDTTCVGPLCSKNCVHEPNATVGRSDREKVIIEERNRRPEGEMRRERRPGIEIEVGR